MKKVILLLMLVTLSFTACGRKETKAPIISGRGAFVAPPGGGAVSSQEMEGRLYGSDDETFRETVAGFASMYLTEREPSVGQISGGYNGDSQTGGWFGGRVTLRSGRMNSSGSAAQSEVSESSQIGLEFWDSYAASNQTTPIVFPTVQSQAPRVTGMVSGNQARIRFEFPGETVLTVEGHFDSMYFEGTLAYDNLVHIDGDVPAGGAFPFRIRTCAFFVCN